MLLAVVLVAGCGSGSGMGGGGSNGGSDAEGGGGKEVEITIKDFTFEPSSVKVSAGDKVTWVNEDSAAHTATASDDAFDTGDIPGGERATETIDGSGTIDYVCEYHPQMKAQLDVS